MKYQNGFKHYSLKNIKNILIQPKWYLGAALLFIAVLGSVLGRQQATVPNQEIVLQFINEDISSNDTRQTIAIVKQELEHIGVEYIQVSDQEDGRLVISYYSKSTVESIKKLLSTQKELALGIVSSDKNELPFRFPSQDTSQGYNLDIYEIQDGQTSYSSLGGKSAVELKSGQQRFLNPNFYIHSETPFIVIREQVLSLDFDFQRDIVITKDYRSHKIPEVRAGPLS